MTATPISSPPARIPILFKDIDFNDPERRPSTHDELFKDIVKLGKTEYHRYSADVTADLREKPWRWSIRQRADRISRIADRCNEGRNNEMEWRLKLEHEVMARFDFEVTWYAFCYYTSMSILMLF